MRSRIVIGCLTLTSVALISAAAQQPESPERPGKKPANSAGVDGFINRMLKLDANDDGKLSREEVQDPRLKSLFDRADADKDDFVTKAELTELHKQESPKGGAGMRGSRMQQRNRGKMEEPQGPPNGRARGGPQQFGPPRPGQILPRFMQDSLKLTDEQRKQIDELQKDVDERLDKILTDEQRQQLRQARDRGPGGPPPDGDGPRPDDQGP